jgi:PhoPQ-activated pathogenicity-related protein
VNVTTASGRRLPATVAGYDHATGFGVVRTVLPMDDTPMALGDSDAVQSLVAFFQSILAGASRPEFSWSVKPDGSIEVKTTTKPLAVKLWQATNSKARDFRLEIIGPAWKSSTLEQQGGGTYVAKVPEPTEGWTAFFAELTFDSGAAFPHKFTTEVHVVPDRLPFAK